MILSVRSLTKHFGSVTALDNVTFEKDRGTTTILLGPNGAGKTTLLRCLATVMRADSGVVEINRIQLGSEVDNRRARAFLGYMPQSLGFYPGFSVKRHLDRIAVLKGLIDPKERSDSISEVLAQVGLRDRADDKIHTLSGGMKRRLGLAQALIGSPSLLLLDEPTDGLDPQQRVGFRQIISALASSGVTVLISTHQIEDVLSITGSVVVLSDGHVLFDGIPSDLARAAAGRVWLAESVPDDAIGWQTPDGRYRVLGGATGEPLEPTVEDGYLTLVQLPYDQ